MSTVKVQGNASGTGSITLASPNTNSNRVLNLPDTDSTVATLGAQTFTAQQTIPTINLTGGQIAFPAAQSASSDANTLDDYEEGTWTPVLNAATGVVYTSAVSGTYVKIGRQVTVNFDARMLTGTVTAISSIGGLPFPCGAISASCASREYYSLGTLWSTVVGPGSSAMALINYTNSQSCNFNCGWSGTLTYQI